MSLFEKEIILNYLYALRSYMQKSNSIILKTVGVMSVNTVITLVVTVYVVAAMLPSAISQLVQVNTSGWGVAEIALMGLLPLLIIIVIIKKFYEDT